MAQPHHWFTQVAHGVEQHDPVRLTAAAQYVEYLASKYSVACFDDWHRVILDSTEQQRVSKFGGLFNLLSRVYPIHKFRAFSGRVSTKVLATLRTLINLTCRLNQHCCTFSTWCRVE